MIYNLKLPIMFIINLTLALLIMIILKFIKEKISEFIWKIIQ